MHKEVTQKQIDQWKETQRKGVAKYQEKLKKKVLVPKKISPVLKSSTPIRKRSKKRAAQERKYNSLVKKMKLLPENEICQWPGCDAPTDDCHHPEGRSGDKLLEKELFKFLCRPHHIYAELHPDEAKEKGISGLRLSK